jgi:hypothetical protein
MRVDLPAPLAPSTATRLFSVHRRLTPDSCCFEAPGYLRRPSRAQKTSRGYMDRTVMDT